jgi:hypothetical protein
VPPLSHAFGLRFPGTELWLLDAGVVLGDVPGCGLGFIVTPRRGAATIGAFQLAHLARRCTRAGRAVEALAVVGDGLDVVAVGVEHERAVVVCVVVVADPWRAIVGAAGGVEGVDRRAVVGSEGDMDAGSERLALDDPEVTRKLNTATRRARASSLPNCWTSHRRPDDDASPRRVSHGGRMRPMGAVATLTLVSCGAGPVGP